MREALFIKKNKDRWLKNQVMPPEDPDEVATEFTRIVDDLSYAKTFYPHSKVTRYLNAQASKIYMGIYQNRKEDRNRITEFWKYEVPLTVRKHHTVMLWVACIFIVFFVVGFYSAKNDESFLREMLGDGYVNMTEENIARGKPFGVYADGNELLMWIWIMLNNIFVAFRYFAEGIFLCFFTIISLVNEGVRLGAFEEMFFAKGLGLQSVLTVFIHGTLEISAIIIAGASGVILGKGWMFPGTGKRIDSFKQGAKDSVKILVSLVPIFIVAAFFEGFVTRYYTMPKWLSALILLSSLSFIVWYYIIYPILLRSRLQRNNQL
ncbi:MAG: hypothetical protein C5B52_06045 [Bacteroidetes bacterium]|nr:MAG: hypothetical protein C5B52_06045 [Bacteroidota bacterium]